jgi:hypothetical protein
VHKFLESCNLRKLNDVDVKEQYQVKISNWFAPLENFDDGGGVYISRAWKNIRICKVQPQRVYIIMNRNSINHGLMYSAQNY